MQSSTLDSNLLGATSSDQLHLDDSPLLASPLQTPLTVASFSNASAQQGLTVNSTADTVNPDDGMLTLREAILAANAKPGADTNF
jgi:CSLREA domain-containing protein